MNRIVKGVASVLGFISLVMVEVALTNCHWRTSTVDWNGITTSIIFENLWVSCVTKWTEMYCREPPLRGYIHACRAFMITSVVLGIFGLLAVWIGIPWSEAAGDSVVLKGRIAVTAGVFFILQGICTMVSVSWYAFNINEDPFYPGIRYEIGEGLYIGWCSAVLAIAGGICLTCSRRMGSNRLPHQVRGTVDSGAAPSGSAVTYV